MKRIGFFLLVVTCLVTSPGTAQQFKITYGGNTALKNDYEDVVQLDNGNIIVLKLIRKTGLTKYNYKPELLLVDRAMTTLSEKDLLISVDDAQPGSLKKIGDQVYYFYHTYKKSNNETTLNGVLINQQTLEPGKTFNMGTFFSEPEHGTGKPQIVLSDDGSKIFMLAEGKANGKNAQMFFAGVYDDQLNSLWSRTVTLASSDINVNFLHFVVDNDGQAYVAIRNNEEGEKYEYKKAGAAVVPAYKIKILTLNAKESMPAEQDIDIQDHFVKDCRLQCDSNKNLIIAGLTQAKYMGNITGIFYRSIAAQKPQDSKTVFKDYPAHLISAVADQKMANDNEKDPGLHREFYIKSLSTRTNGSVDLLVEYHYRTRVTGGSDKDIYFTAGDLMNVNIATNQKIVFTRIPKRQLMKNASIFLGVAVISYKDKLLLLYNDNEDNEGDDGNSKFTANFNKSVLVMVTVDGNGKLTKKTMVNQNLEDYIFLPGAFHKIDAGKFFITSAFMKGISRSTRFGLLEITN